MREGKGEKSMEATFAGLVSEVEKAVQPLGFSIKDADRREKTALIMEEIKDVDDGELIITIVRKGKIG